MSKKLQHNRPAQSAGQKHIYIVLRELKMICNIVNIFIQMNVNWFILRSSIYFVSLEMIFRCWPPLNLGAGDWTRIREWKLLLINVLLWWNRKISKSKQAPHFEHLKSCYHKIFQNLQVGKSDVHIMRRKFDCSNLQRVSRQQCYWAWWRYQMEPFSALLALCAGNSPVPVNSPHKGQWRGALMFSLICAWINDWVNNRDAGDLRRHHGHYDVNVKGACRPNLKVIWNFYSGKTVVSTSIDSVILVIFLSCTCTLSMVSLNLLFQYLMLFSNYKAVSY